MEDSYEFDPCSIDDVDMDTAGFVSIDDWKPAPQKARIPKSEWRQRTNDGNYDLDPGIDDLRKIEMYLQKGFPDCEIMEVFGISSETIVAIKRKCYCPTEGISIDNQSKILAEFKRVEKRINDIYESLACLVDTVFEGANRESLWAFKSSIKYLETKKRLAKEANKDDKDELDKKREAARQMKKTIAEDRAKALIERKAEEKRIAAEAKAKRGGKPKMRVNLVLKHK